MSPLEVTRGRRSPNNARLCLRRGRSGRLPVRVLLRKCSYASPALGALNPNQKARSRRRSIGQGRRTQKGGGSAQQTRAHSVALRHRRERRDHKRKGDRMNGNPRGIRGWSIASLTSKALRVVPRSEEWSLLRNLLADGGARCHIPPFKISVRWACLGSARTPCDDAAIVSI
jgi:hypothetical protein